MRQALCQDYFKIFVFYAQNLLLNCNFYYKTNADKATLRIHKQILRTAKTNIARGLKIND